MNSSRLLSAAASLSRSLPDLRGKSNLGWMLMRRSSLDGQWSVTLRDGSRIVMPRASHMAWSTAFRGAYDSAPQRLLRAYIAPNSIVLDIGAALGLWTVPFAKAAAARKSELWAFEPLPGNHRWLQANIAANGLANVTIEACALAAEPGTAFMGGEVGGGTGVILDEGVEVPVRALDDFAFPEPVSAIKMDVEGYELQVLRGASRLLDHDRPVILGEFSREWLQTRDEDLDGFLEQLRERHYFIYSVELYRTRPWMALSGARLHGYDRSTATEELLLVPRERSLEPS